MLHYRVCLDREDQMQWQVKEAKQRFGEVLHAAESEPPAEPSITAASPEGRIAYGVPP
jgi:hypothetical protein